MTAEAVTLAPLVEAEPQEPRARLASLFDAHHQRLYGLARRLAGNADDARDLVQDTYLRAAQRLASVPQGTAGEEAWLVRVLVNLCRDRWRRTAVRRRIAPLVMAEARVRSPHPESAMIARATIWRALLSLPPRRRAVLVMCELEGLSISSVAALLGVNPITVRWHLSTGRRQLANVIGEK